MIASCSVIEKTLWLTGSCDFCCESTHCFIKLQLVFKINDEYWLA